MRSSEEEPVNGHLTISALFKLGDPFLILKLCTTNKKALYYVEKYPEKLEAVIESVIKEANFEEKQMRPTVYEILTCFDLKPGLVRLEFLGHMLDYQTFLEKRREKRPDWWVDVYDRNLRYFDNQFLQEFFWLFFGTKERVYFFFEHVNQLKIAKMVTGGESVGYLRAGYLCYALSQYYGYNEIRITFGQLMDYEESHIAFRCLCILEDLMIAFERNSKVVFERI